MPDPDNLPLQTAIKYNPHPLRAMESEAKARSPR